MPELDPNRILTEIMAASANMQVTAGAMLEKVKSMDDKLTGVITENSRIAGIVEGNGGGIKEGIEWRLAMTEEIEKNCQGRNIEKIVAEFRDYVEKELGPIRSYFTARKIEDATQKHEEAKTEKAVEQATSGAIVIKYKWVNDFMKKYWPIIKHPLMLWAYFLIGSGGATYLNRHNILHGFGSFIKYILKAMYEAYTSGGN